MYAPYIPIGAEHMPNLHLRRVCQRVRNGSGNLQILITVFLVNVIDSIICQRIVSCSGIEGAWYFCCPAEARTVCPRYIKPAFVRNHSPLDQPVRGDVFKHVSDSVGKRPVFVMSNEFSACIPCEFRFL